MSWRRRTNALAKIWVVTIVMVVTTQGAARAQGSSEDETQTRPPTAIGGAAEDQAPICLIRDCMVKRPVIQKDPKLATWFRGGVLVSSKTLGEWGLLSAGLGTVSDTGDRFGVGANVVIDGGRRPSGGLGSDGGDVWGAHFSYDSTFGDPRSFQFYSHFEFGFLVEPGHEEDGVVNKVRAAFTTGLGIDMNTQIGGTSFRFGPEFGYHWALSSPYALLQIGLDT